MSAGLERVKVICSREDGQKRVSISRSLRDKRIGEYVCSVSIQFKRVGVLNLKKNRVLPANEAFGEIIDFISSEQTS